MKTHLVIQDHSEENYKTGLTHGIFFGLFIAAIIASLVGWSRDHNQPVNEHTFCNSCVTK
jgi:hypothetical protein